MNRIDHRILVHASPEKVWSFLSDIENNPAWQVNCRELSFLTSARSGQGTRWRMIDESGRPYIIEITAWYNQLGYEYIIIDGSSYKHNQGRIRLQEIAEGTIVEWSFSYELGGILSGVRNALIVRRNIENTIVDSLWTLWRQIGQSQDDAGFHAKSLMRDAPDVEQRASYQPRHPVVVQSTGTPIPYKQDPPAPFIPEPPITHDDTRPRPAIHVEEDAQPAATNYSAESVNEPDFLSGMTTSEFDRISQPEKVSPEHMRATTIDPVNFTPPTENVKEPAEITAVDEPERSPFAPPREATQPEFSGEPEHDEQPVTPLTKEAPQPIESKVDDATEVLPKSPQIAPRTYDKEDTSQVSVFDLFGVPKPSETQQMEAVKVDETGQNAVTPQDQTGAQQSEVQIEEPTYEAPPPAPAAPPAEEITVANESVKTLTTPSMSTTIVVRSGRTGRRYILRQHVVQLRRPESKT